MQLPVRDRTVPNHGNLNWRHPWLTTHYRLPVSECEYGFGSTWNSAFLECANQPVRLTEFTLLICSGTHWSFDAATDLCPGSG